MAASDENSASALGAQVIRKATWRLIPFMALLYFINYLDRVNVGFAALTMNADLGFSATVYGNGAGILFLGYVFFMVPSNIILEKVGARQWVAVIMAAWGAISAGMAFVQGPTSFYIMRFLLGVAEAGFFPGMILYMTYWFPAHVRARITGLFLLAVPLSSVLGAPVSSLLLELEGFGLVGWQWMFIIQGVPAIFLTIAVLRVLTNKPEDADWLNAEEKSWLAGVMEAERIQKEMHRTTNLAAVFLSVRVWLFGLMYFGIAIGVYGLTLWLPQIIKGFGGLSNIEVGLLTSVPYALAALGMFLWGAHSDKTGERTWHVALPSLVGGIALAASAYMVNVPVLAFVALTIASVGIYGSLPSFWTLPTGMLSGTAAAGGIALITAVGNTGGYFGPALVGYIRDATQSYTYGLLLLAAFSVMTAVLVLAMSRAKPAAQPAPA